VTGAGSAGCPVAAGLSESGEYRLLVLHAGGPASNPPHHIPPGHTKTDTDPQLTWRVENDLEDRLNAGQRQQPELTHFRGRAAAAVEAGVPANPDFNVARQEGVGYYQTTTGNRRRWSAAKAYLRPAKNRANLTVATSAHATRVVIEDGRAVAVEYRTPKGLVTARCRGEVVVSGGVYGSPQLLQLSGLGPAAL